MTIAGKSQFSIGNTSTQMVVFSIVSLFLRGGKSTFEDFTLDK